MGLTIRGIKKATYPHDPASNKAYYLMNTDQKRQEALKALHHACRGLCGCSCHVTPEPPK